MCAKLAKKEVKKCVDIGCRVGLADVIFGVGIELSGLIVRIDRLCVEALDFSNNKKSLPLRVASYLCVSVPQLYNASI